MILYSLVIVIVSIFALIFLVHSLADGKRIAALYGLVLVLILTGIVVQRPYEAVPGISCKDIGSTSYPGYITRGVAYSYIRNNVFVTNTEGLKGFDEEFEGAEMRFLNAETEINELFVFEDPMVPNGYVAAEVWVKAKPFDRDTASRFSFEKLEKDWTWGPVARYRLHKEWNRIKRFNLQQPSRQMNELRKDIRTSLHFYLANLTEGMPPDTGEAADRIKSDLAGKWYSMHSPLVKGKSDNWD